MRIYNRLSLTPDESMVDYQYDDANRLTSVNGQAYTWDNNGNPLNGSVRSHTYAYAYANRSAFPPARHLVFSPPASS